MSLYFRVNQLTDLVNIQILYHKNPKNQNKLDPDRKKLDRSQMSIHQNSHPKTLNGKTLYPTKTQYEMKVMQMKNCTPCLDEMAFCNEINIILWVCGDKVRSCLHNLQKETTLSFINCPKKQSPHNLMFI